MGNVEVAATDYWFPSVECQEEFIEFPVPIQPFVQCNEIFPRIRDICIDYKVILKLQGEGSALFVAFMVSNPMDDI